MVEAPDRFRLGWGTKNLKWDVLYMEKAVATHSSVLAWRIPGTEGPGGRPSTGSHRVGHDRSDSVAAAAPVSC